MSSWLETYKPVTSSRLQLLLAGLVWSIVGTGLICVGTYWVLSTSTHIMGLLALSLCMGLVKSLLILDKVASRIVKRIVLRGEGRCLVSFYSVRVWVIVIIMILMGRLLRSMGLSYALLGVIYSAVGTSLLMSSRSIWLAWKDHPQAD
jgi:hypothetical protein